MTPVNQVILGNPLLTQEDLNSRLELMKQYETKLMSLNKPNTIWDDIDRELKSMTDSLGAKYFVAGFVDSLSGNVVNTLPAIIFLVAVFLAFATGTSYSSRSRITGLW